MRVFVLVALVGLAACRDAPKPTATTPEPRVDAGATLLDAGLDAGADDAALGNVPAGIPPFVFTESPSPTLIPNAPIRGVAHGQPFDASNVLFEATRHEWRISFCEKALARPTDFVHGQAIHLYLRDTIAVERPIVHPMKAGAGYFAIRAPDATNPEGTVSWTSDHAYFLEVTQLSMKPYEPSGPLVQVAGTASGRVYVAYRGGARFLNSGVAGTFSNAIVRYYGKPFFAE